MKSNSTPKPTKEPLQETEASHSSYGTQPFLSNHVILIKKNLNITIAGTITAQTAELVQRYGLAVKEHVWSYVNI